ncbi:Protein C45E1.4 [Aphelenchoides avenae]|nr:Protein C45E1.4 [Aphelenchus avenae]
MSTPAVVLFLLLLLSIFVTIVDCTEEAAPSKEANVAVYVTSDDGHDGNYVGYEYPDGYNPTQGLAGHGGFFRVFNWTTEELSTVSLWHATLQYHKVIRMVEAKLNTSHMPAHVRHQVHSFIIRHMPPRSVRTLLNKHDRNLIKQRHRSRDVDGVLQVVSDRLSNLDSEAEDEVLGYLRDPHRA